VAATTGTSRALQGVKKTDQANSKVGSGGLSNKTGRRGRDKNNCSAARRWKNGGPASSATPPHAGSSAKKSTRIVGHGTTERPFKTHPQEVKTVWQRAPGKSREKLQKTILADPKGNRRKDSARCKPNQNSSRGNPGRFHKNTAPETKGTGLGRNTDQEGSWTKLIRDGNGEKKET